jgi:hypothetical protein
MKRSNCAFAVQQCCSMKYSKMGATAEIAGK